MLKAMLGEMQEPYSPSPPQGMTRRVEDPVATAFLSDITTLRYLLPFLARERTVGEVARELNVRANSLLYRVRKMLGLGLLTITREVPRRGRAVKHYRSSADSFFIPFAATPAETAEALFLMWETPWQQLLFKSISRAVLGPVVQPTAPWGLQLYRDEQTPHRPIRMIPVPRQDSLLETNDPATPVAFGGFSTGLCLEPKEARALQQELITLVQRYYCKTGNTPYLLRLGLAPLEEQDTLPPMSVI